MKGGSRAQDHPPHSSGVDARRSAPTSASPAEGGRDLPIQGTAPGSSTLNLATGEAHLLVTGQLSHFGLTTIEQHGLVTPNGLGTFSFITT
jgi:hypothetical protein